MFAWIRKIFALPDPEPLPDLGFAPRLYELHAAPSGSYVVTILNDDKTPMDFVVRVIRDYFGIPVNDATRIMLDVHTKGAADIRAMSKRDATRLVSRIREEASKHIYPLQCSVRPIEDRDKT